MTSGLVSNVVGVEHGLCEPRRTYSDLNPAIRNLIVVQVGILSSFRRPSWNRYGDQFELVHEATRKVLDVDTAGRFAQAWSRNQGTNQRWLLEPAEGSWMRIRSVANQEVLDVKGYSTEAGTRVITYPAKLRGNQNPACNGFENQLWVLREVQ